MSTSENRALVVRWIKAWEGESLDALDQLAAPDYEHSATHGRAVSLQQFKQGLGMVRAGLADYRVTIDDLVAEGDRVVARWSGGGINCAPLFGRPPTGRPATGHGVTIYQIVDGKVQRDWEFLDLPGLLRQLDPAPPDAPVR